MEADQGMRIGVIGGAGWLGGAIIDAALQAGIVKPEHLSLSFRSHRPDRLSGAYWTTHNQSVADRSDVVLLCVRPADWPTIKVDLKGKLLISVMAGITSDALSERHETDRVVRALPNAAAEVHRSYTPWIASSAVSDEDRSVVTELFEACGAQDEVFEESYIDYFTGLSGSGPAFPALLASAMMQDAISQGIPADIAQRAVNTLLIGAGRLLEKRDVSPSETTQTFLEYRGTTAAAITVMRDGGFDAAIANGLTAASKAAAKLGDPLQNP